MDDRFKSSQSDASASNDKSGQPPSLEAGLAALRRKDYSSAIALLQAVAQTATDKPTVTKAQMSLVMAHDRSGNINQAIAISQSLSKSSNRQVRLWATRMLDELNERHPTTTPPVSVESSDLEEATGFMPLDALPSTSIQLEQTTLQPEESVALEDESGFVPIDATTRAENREQSPLPSATTEDEDEDATGFMPLTEAPSPLRNPTQRSPHEVAPQPNPEPFSESAISENAIPIAESEPLQNTEEAAQQDLEQAPLPVSQDDPSHLESPSSVEATQPRTSHRQPSMSSPSTSLVNASTAPREWTWRQAGRASKWGTLGSVDLASLWAVELVTVVAMVFVVRTLVQGAIALFNSALVQFRWVIDLRQYTIFTDPFWLVVLILGVLFFTTPWVMDGILRQSYRAKSFSLQELEASSPEAVRVLKRVCNQRRYPLPSLRVLPITVPVALTYGFLPQNARIAVSQGLLKQLNEDEIAAVLMGELGHVIHWDFGILSWVTLVAQLPYLLYWSVATWGNRQRNSVLQAIAVGIAALGYGLFWLLHWVGLWLSRLRLYYSDRTASETTGNPNGFTRALLKIAVGIADDIHRQRSTSPLLQSFDLLTPVGYQSALTLGSAYSHASFENLLHWEQVNPHRRWLAINNTHSLMGDRLQQLATYARHWRLATELDFNPSASISRSPHLTRRFWLQSAPFLGVLIGLLIVGCFWLVGTIAGQIGQTELVWMADDRSIFWGCLLAGFSIGSILRINAFFPDLKPSTLQIEPSLPDLLSVPQALPIDSQPIRLQGTLLGQPGIRNILASDLILQSQTGSIKLHYLPLLGPLGHLLPQATRPHQFVNSSVTITGWFRRGATPWIDVDTIQPQRGAKLQAAHPLWSTLLAFSAGVLGAYIIFQGGA